MQDILFAKTLYSTLEEDHSYAEIHTGNGVVQVKPHKLLLPGEGTAVVQRWRSLLADSNPDRIDASGFDCAVIEGFAVDLSDRQVPFELRVRVTVNPEHVTAIVQRWIA